jgi:hypothetical protein
MDEGNVSVEQQSKLPSDVEKLEIESSVEAQEKISSPESNEPASTVADTDENEVSSTSNEDKVDGKNLKPADESLDEKSAVLSSGLTPMFISSQNILFIYYLNA